jgi:hypothetical protein
VQLRHERHWAILLLKPLPASASRVSADLFSDNYTVADPAVSGVRGDNLQGRFLKTQSHLARRYINMNDPVLGGECQQVSTWESVLSVAEVKGW